MPPPTNGEVRPIKWHCVSAKEQSHQMCRYCDRPATHMRKQGRQGWTALCESHAFKRKWRHITPMRNISLQEVDGTRIFPILGEISLLSFNASSDGYIWHIPIDNRLWQVILTEISLMSHKVVEVNQNEANEQNTMLVTCHDCGHLLKCGDRDYGTTHGWCGCLPAEEKEVESNETD